MTGHQERYATSLMDTFGPPRRVLARGRGCYVWDTDGTRYLDLLAGIAVNALGHGHPAVVETIARQAATLGHVSNFFATEPQIALAERLLAVLGVDDGRVFFTSSGTEANEAALKMVRRTGRAKVVAAHGAFHGRTLGALSLTEKPAYREPFEPLPGPVTWVPYGDEGALRDAVDETTAAVVLEPIQGEAGVVVPPDGYLAAARTITRDAGALLWLDEVQTGVGRTGTWFAAQHSAVTADIVTVAKGLGGGFPIGACIGVGPAGQLLGRGQHGTTFGGNPLGAATALTVLDVIEKEGLLERARMMGAAFRAALADLPGVTGTRGAGLLVAAVLDGPSAPAAARSALDEGVIVNDCTPTVLRLAPPLVVEDRHIDEAAPRLAAALTAVEKQEHR